jgi:hypothetical protein
MSTKFVSKVIGGAALGTAVMIFGAPGIVSAHYDPPTSISEVNQANIAVIEKGGIEQAAEALVVGEGDAVALNLTAVFQINIAAEAEFATLACSYNGTVNGEDAYPDGLAYANEVNSVKDAIAMLESLNGDADAECVADDGLSHKDGLKKDKKEKKDEKDEKDDFKKDKHDDLKKLLELQ